MYVDSDNTMNSSTRIGIGGARHHNKISRIMPVDSKILMFMCSICLIEFYIRNSQGNLIKNVLLVYTHVVINEV